tara:strand:+ start:738 stop:920 length:183 start_codon:yes stop_codon:yes gene_type:complete
MVAFARAKAKSIFSKLLFNGISTTQVKTSERLKKEDLSCKNKKGSSYFLDSLKNGGIWLS